MLVLSRKRQETIVIDGRIKVTIIQVRGNQVRLGVEAPQDVSILRSELEDSGVACPSCAIVATCPSASGLGGRSSPL